MKPIPFKKAIPLILVISLWACKEPLPPLAEDFSESIRLNQVGYYPNAIKKAVLTDSVNSSEFQVIDRDKNEVVFTGELSEAFTWKFANEKVRIADFSAFKSTGNYSVRIQEAGDSYPFEIKENVFKPALLGAAKALYYQRAGMELEETYAGKWKRAMGHPDDSVLFHPSSGRTEGYISSPKGWYDAGDFNKYVVNGSFSLGQLFLFYEQYPEAIKDKDLNIPESGNQISDILDEIKYEMDWLLSMQDEDGGLFHKLTTKRFQAMVMPNEPKSLRYIVGKGTAATLDFAAVASQAYRVFLKSNPVYAKQCLEASKRAYVWAKQNPATPFVNPEDVNTGQYGDDDFSAEWYWAAAELYVNTKEIAYKEDMEAIHFANPLFRLGDNWTEYMHLLGVYSLLEHQALDAKGQNALKKSVLDLADGLVEKSKTLDYFQPVDNFQWGSNSDVLNAAIVMAQAYRLDPQPKYLEGAQQATDYVLGTNATGYSFLTGFGDKTPMFIHHRQSEADGIEEPVPGLLSGGPNNGKQDTSDGVVYPLNASPMKSWVDVEPSYASNEICLNWNTPLIYMLGFLEQESK